MLISSLDVLIGLLLGCLFLSCMGWIGFPCIANLFFMWAGLVFHLLLFSFCMRWFFFAFAFMFSTRPLLELLGC